MGVHLYTGCPWVNISSYLQAAPDYRWATPGLITRGQRSMGNQFFHVTPSTREFVASWWPLAVASSPVLPHQLRRFTEQMRFINNRVSPFCDKFSIQLSLVILSTLVGSNVSFEIQILLFIAYEKRQHKERTQNRLTLDHFCSILQPKTCQSPFAFQGNRTVGRSRLGATDWAQGCLGAGCLGARTFGRNRKNIYSKYSKIWISVVMLHQF